MNKIYLAGAPDDEDFYPVARALQDREWYVANLQGDLRRDLREQIKLMLTAQAVCFLDTWWTTSEANALQHIAAWTRMTIVSPHSMEVINNARR